MFEKNKHKKPPGEFVKKKKKFLMKQKKKEGKVYINVFIFIQIKNAKLFSNMISQQFK